MAFTESYQFAGPNSVYVPRFDKQANLIVNFSRDWKKNKVNQLMTITPVVEEIGRFPRTNPMTKVNITDNYLQSRKWQDGSPAPLDQLAHLEIEWDNYFCQRYSEPTVVGYKMKAQAAFDLEEVYLNNLANRMMTAKAYEFYSVLQDTNSYLSDATDTATNLGGGVWSAATSTARYIQKGLMAAVQAIVKNTGGSVKASDLVLVVGPVVANKMAASGEIADYLAQNPVAPEYLKGTLFEDQLAQYGLPPVLYGIKIIVDENVRDSSALGAAPSKSFIPGDTSAYLIARQGALVGAAGGGNFSFVHCFQYVREEMLVETWDDVQNKRFVHRLVDTRHIKVVAPHAAYLLTSVVS